MGWDWYIANNYKNGKIDRKKEIDDICNRNRTQVVQSCLRGTTYYGAIKNIDTKEVYAVVYLTSTNGREFGYKDMDETMNPYYYDCPESILKELTPTDNEWANFWRKNCYANIERKKTELNLNKLPIGTKIKFTLTFDTSRNKEGDTVILEKRRRTAKSTYWVQGGYCYWIRPLMRRVKQECKIEVLA